MDIKFDYVTFDTWHFTPMHITHAGAKTSAKHKKKMSYSVKLDKVGKVPKGNIVTSFHSSYSSAHAVSRR